MLAELKQLSKVSKMSKSKASKIKITQTITHKIDHIALVAFFKAYLVTIWKALMYIGVPVKSPMCKKKSRETIQNSSHRDGKPTRGLLARLYSQVQWKIWG